MVLSSNAMIVLERRYLKKDAEGRPLETPQELFRRVAGGIAGAEALYGKTAGEIFKIEEEFYALMAQLDFLPNSPTLMNAGKELGQLSACFVLPVEDSMESIFEAIKNTALIHKSGGGTGFAFSRLRPKNDLVATTNGISSGPVSFMKVFNSATEAIKQGGTRRGANMAILDVTHPDVMEFIEAKKTGQELTNFNLSVGISEDFMQRVEDDRPYSLLNPRTGEVIGEMRARLVFERMVELAWETGDPGLVFLDRINRDNPTPLLGNIESTNPCGEQPLLPYESCNLGSLNLAYMVREGKIDYHKLGQTVDLAVRFLDNVIDVNKYPIPKIEEMTKNTRKIGLGVMGFADMLIQLGVPYNSPKALMTAEELMSFISRRADEASELLAKERGVFPAFPGSVYDKAGGKRLRNATRTTIAPTGTISIIAGCSSGIEPLFALAFYRRVLNEDKLVEVNQLFKETAIREGFYQEEIMRQIAQKGTVQGLDEVPERFQQLFVSAHDIDPEWHVKIQAAFQKYTDNAVSKTINFRKEATREEVREAYLLAYRLGCKGITIYRDGSKERQVIYHGTATRDKKIGPRARPSVIRGTTEKVMTGCGNLYVTINEDDEGLFEVFAQMGKAGGCAMAQSEAISRLVSLALRSGVDTDAVLKQIKGIRCPAPSWAEGGMVLSCPDAIARAVENYLKRHGEQVKRGKGSAEKVTNSGPAGNGGHRRGEIIGVCPDCGCSLAHEEGCVVCHSCGFSKC
jgi:ribonucleoside-diphosphate reductase alpha chain